MKVNKIVCPSCGAPLSIPDDGNSIKCESCGTLLSIDRSESCDNQPLSPDMIRDQIPDDQPEQKLFSFRTNASHSTVQERENSPASQKHKTSVPSKSNTKSIKKGCLYFILIYLVTPVLFSIFAAILTAIIPGISEIILGSLFVLTMTIGLAIAARIFFENSTSDFIIHGFPGLPSMTVRSRKNGKAIDNPILIKLLAGISAFSIVFGCGLSLSFFCTLFSKPLSDFLIAPALLLAIAAGLVVFFRTSILDG